MESLTPTKRRRETIYEKADRILADESRVETLAQAGTSYWLGNVKGDHGTYRVCAVSPAYAEALGFPGEMVSCRCIAGRQETLCSHAIVGDEMRVRGGV